VLLIYPATDTEQMSIIPLSLLYVAQPLLEENIHVEIIDQRFERDFFNRLGQRIHSDLICIGISCITGPQIAQVARISEFIRKRSSVPIVLGGPHATLLPEQTLDSGLVDYVVIGKGEAAFLRFVKALKRNESVKSFEKIGFKENGSIIVNRGAIKEINVRKIPYHLFFQYGKPPAIPIVSSFGCPHRCAFCAVKILYPKYFERPTDDVMFMIEEAMSLKPQLINFIDDNFLLNRKRVKEILSQCWRKGFNFQSLCTGRVDEVLRLDDDTLRFLRERGIVGIFFGIESGSKKILELVNKGITPEMVLKLNLRLRKEGIMPHYSFMAGFPTETKDDLVKTIRLMDRLKKENPRAVIWKLNKYTPYPGTELFDLAIQEGFKPPERFEEWSHIYFYSKEYGLPYDISL
jgi:anaerobic magnesium-protoporphyrin IX monomethyl ester cyclase